MPLGGTESSQQSTGSGPHSGILHIASCTCDGRPDYDMHVRMSTVDCPFYVHVQYAELKKKLLDQGCTPEDIEKVGVFLL